MCESYVQPYSKPFCSPFFSTSTRRVYGGSGSAVTPKLSICSSSPDRWQGNQHIAASASGRSALKRGQSGRPNGHDGQGPGNPNQDEAGSSVARQREGEADERRADKDQEGRAAVDEPDGGTGRIRAKCLRSGERCRERESGGQAEQRRARDPGGQRDVEEQQECPRGSQQHAHPEELRGLLRAVLED